MILSDLEKMASDALAERDAVILKAEAKYQDAMKHIKWFKDRLPKVASKRAEGNQKSEVMNGRGSLVAAVKECIAELKEFTTNSVVDWLVKEHPEVDAANRKTPVSVSLSRLKELGFIEDLGKSGEGKSHKYRITRSLS